MGFETPPGTNINISFGDREKNKVDSNAEVTQDIIDIFVSKLRTTLTAQGFDSKYIEEKEAEFKEYAEKATIAKELKIKLGLMLLNSTKATNEQKHNDGVVITTRTENVKTKSDKLENKCSRCGAEVDLGANFCGQCGNRLN